MAPEPAARPATLAAPLSKVRRLMLRLIFDRSVMVISGDGMSGHRFGRRDGYRTAGLQRACKRRAPGDDDALADVVIGGVELALGELGGDLGAIFGCYRDHAIGALVFDFVDGACDRRTIDSRARPLQCQAIVANREGLAADRNDIVAADESCREFGAGMV